LSTWCVAVSDKKAEHLPEIYPTVISAQERVKPGKPATRERVPVDGEGTHDGEHTHGGKPGAR
jgi:hypothetical protein